jgi:hypothetical protein
VRAPALEICQGESAEKMQPVLIRLAGRLSERSPASRVSPEKVAAFEDFVELLAQRNDRQLTQAAAKLAEKAFRRIWNNPADAAYHRL